MKLFFFLSIILIFSSCISQRVILTESEMIKASIQFVEYMAEGHFDLALNAFDESITDTISISKLQELWQKAQNQAGAYRQWLGPGLEDIAPENTQVLVCEFEKEPLDLFLTFDEQKQIKQVHFDKSKGLKSYQPADYVLRSTFMEMDTSIYSAGLALPAKVLRPMGPSQFPALVLVQGFGSWDRDGSIGPNKPFRDLAEGLATQGLLVLRYDKRWKAFPDQIIGDNFTVRDDVIDDALAAVSMLRKMKGVNIERIFLLGHGLAGWLVPEMARLYPRLAGLIIMAPADQYSVAAENDENLALIPPNQLPERYWSDLQKYRPLEQLLSMRQPVLILHAERDFQIQPAEVNHWEQQFAQQDNIDILRYPELNHYFMHSNSAAGRAEYKRIGHVSNQVVLDIARWIKSFQN